VEKEKIYLCAPMHQGQKTQRNSIKNGATLSTPYYTNAPKQGGDSLNGAMVQIGANTPAPNFCRCSQ